MTYMFLLLPFVHTSRTTHDSYVITQDTIAFNKYRSVLQKIDIDTNPLLIPFVFQARPEIVPTLVPHIGVPLGRAIYYLPWLDKSI